jgi:TetR/AcrR family transcriptional repressor of nem operon
MRYRQGHKAQTRQRILREASQRLRSEGIGRLAIDDLMRRLDLTHGGFYAHFASKDALVAEACAQEFTPEEAEIIVGPADALAEDALASLISHYLSARHRDRPEMGCYLPALAGEMAHASPVTRQTFTRAFQRYVARVAQRLPGETPQARTDTALVLLSAMAGAVAVSRALDAPALSEHLLVVCRTFYSRAFAADGTRAQQERKDHA